MTANHPPLHTVAGRDGHHPRHLKSRHAASLRARIPFVSMGFHAGGVAGPGRPGRLRWRARFPTAPELRLAWVDLSGTPSGLRDAATQRVRDLLAPAGVRVSGFDVEAGGGCADGRRPGGTDAIPSPPARTAPDRRRSGRTQGGKAAERVDLSGHCEAWGWISTGSSCGRSWSGGTSLRPWRWSSCTSSRTLSWGPSTRPRVFCQRAWIAGACSMRGWPWSRASTRPSGWLSAPSRGPGSSRPRRTWRRTLELAMIRP